MGERGPLPGKRKKVVAWVRREISLGRLKRGMPLPSRKWFCERFGIAPVPVQQAFDELREDGLIIAVPGHGTRVADRLPFADRYLLLLMSRADNVGSQLFPKALRKAAAAVEHRRQVKIDVRDLMDAQGDSVPYAEMMNDVRRLRYAGVIAQGVTESGHGLDTVTNVDGVPMAYFGNPSALTQGSHTVSLPIYTDGWRKALFQCMFDDLRAAGASKVSVFQPDDRGCDSRSRFVELAAASGLTLVEDGFQCIEVNRWSPRQVDRLFCLFLRSDAGRLADGILLGDDNFLPLFADACRKVLGRSGAGRYRIVSHCNFPHPPQVDFPCRFRGPDLEGTIQAFLDYADDCHAGKRRPRPPELPIGSDSLFS